MAELTYRTAFVALRSPRAIVLFRSTANWRGWVRRAIQATSFHWGGGGYILVPVNDDGTIDPRVRRAAIAYDPDYVVVLTADIAAWVDLDPDVVAIPDPSEANYDRAIAARVDDGTLDRAAKDLFKLCSPLNYDRDRGMIPIHHISVNDSIATAPFLSAPRSGGVPFAALSSSPSWDDDISLFALARTGAAPERTQRSTPARKSLLRWVIEPLPDRAPAELLWFRDIEYSYPASSAETWFKTVNPELANITNGFAEDPGAVVIGSTVHDFCLALAYDRLLGYGLWLTPDIIAQEFAGDDALRHELVRKLGSLYYEQPIPVESTSLPEVEIEKCITALLKTSFTVISENPIDDIQTEPALVIRPTKVRRGLATLALKDHLGDPLTMPILLEDDGTLVSQSPVPPLVPLGLEAPVPLNVTGLPSWIVDFSLESRTTPQGRGLASKYLTTEAKPDSTNLIRSSRAGVSYHAASLGLISSASVLSSRLARPHIQQPGIFRWVQAMAESQGVEATYSRPGQFAVLVASRLGSRARLIEVGSGPFLPFLREFVGGERASASVHAFPEGDGVELEGRMHYLTFDALSRTTPDMDQETRRDFIDELLKARLMRQGVIMNCSECGSPSFISIDELQQQFECKLCGAYNEVERARWKSLGAEPGWFYDLHRAFRKIIDGNGDVVLLASRHIGNHAIWSFDDAGEIEFRSTTDPNMNFEVDAVAHVDGEVVIVEAKSNGRLGNGSQRNALIQKRMHAARLLRADRVVFATTAAEWDAKAMKSAANISTHDFDGLPVDFVPGLTNHGSKATAGDESTGMSGD